MRSFVELRESASPATNAPTIGASFADSAISANASVNASATATSVPAERALCWSHWNKRGAIIAPSAVATTRNATASSRMPASVPIEIVPSDTMRTTTVRMTRPSTSSATAAPSTVRASTDASARRSLNTRAVMPTLVAESAAARNSAVLPSYENASATANPAAIGTTTPITATDSEARPTAPSSRRSISMPTWSRSRITPSSPRTRSVSFVATRPSTEGPMTTPARISATTPGMPTRSASSAATFAATSRIRMSSRTEPTSNGPQSVADWSRYPRDLTVRTSSPRGSTRRRNRTIWTSSALRVGTPVGQARRASTSRPTTAP